MLALGTQQNKICRDLKLFQTTASVQTLLSNRMNEAFLSEQLRYAWDFEPIYSPR
jgi:hypothetical protein